GNRGWTELRDGAGLSVLAAGPHEKTLRRACGRLAHVDDADRLGKWRAWLRAGAPPDIDTLSEYDRRLLRMFLAQVLDQAAASSATLNDGVSMLWEHPQILSELGELFDVLVGRISHVSFPLAVPEGVPLRVHARYTRLEILSACGIGEGATALAWQSGVWYHGVAAMDLFAFTLDKTSGQFSPTTRYKDYAISRDLIHWQSRSTTRAESATGRRYQSHKQLGSHVLIFARLNADERAFHFLGPASYVSHTGELPMSVTWRLHHALPGDLFQVFAAAVA
ncbi:MAG TPA: DUF3427 domain-containing protein, partial [Gemmatimonas sp.]|nr:DUF3427 domain-containing protein [Gemmatimonas sp.]